MSSNLGVRSSRQFFTPWPPMEAAKRCARGESGAITEFGLRLGLPNYPESRQQNGVTITKSALQYIETHDHERFICTYGTHFPDDDAGKRGEQG